MSDTALYRKYRPENFKEVIEQGDVVSVLSSEIKSGNIAHSYLFAGSRGTGKTTVARIFAREIGASANDIYEIDAASNRGIDDVREIRDGVNVLPFDSKYKVYIIDEAHMLTKEAWNAFLKTLEEPPAHAVFILATTEMDKVPETVVSRCQVFAFKKPNQEILKAVTLATAKKEGAGLDSAGAELIALLGDGSFRDTHGVLQKVISGAYDIKKITLEDVEKVTGAPKNTLVNNIVVALSEKDSAKGLEAITVAVAANVDIKLFIKLILQKLRFVLLLRYAPNLAEKIKKDLTEADYELLHGIASKKESHISSATLSELLGALDITSRSSISHLPLELVIIKLTT